MHAGKLVFAQLTDLIHPEQFRRCVRRYDGDYKVKTFSCWNHCHPTGNVKKVELTR